MNLNSVFERMAEELAIKRGITEDILSWKCRIAYSVTAKRGLDALWEQDVGEQHGTVSLSHLMGTMQQVLRTFYVLCPDIEASIQNFIQHPILLGKKPEALLGKLLQEGGCFYHVSYRAAPSPLCEGTAGRNNIPSRGTIRSCTVYERGRYVYGNACRWFSRRGCVSVWLRKIVSGADLDRLENSLPEESRASMDGWEFLELSRINGKYLEISS